MTGCLPMDKPNRVNFRMKTDALLIFDLDGTLFQTERVTVPAVQAAFAAYGLAPPTEEQVCFFFGKPVEDYEAWLARQCSPETADELVQYANALELQYIGERGCLYPGTLETLEMLRGNGYDLAICSNGPEPYVREVVRAHGLASFFPVVFARDTRYADKEEMVGLILEEARPARFAVVGDRSEDIEAAHLHGGQGIAAVYGFGNVEEWRGADAHVHSIREVPSCAERLFSTPR